MTSIKLIRPTCLVFFVISTSASRNEQTRYGATVITTPADFRFAINRTTGNVTLNQTLCDSVGFLTSQVSVQVRVADGGAVSLQTFGTLFVRVTELAPGPFVPVSYVVPLRLVVQ